MTQPSSNPQQILQLLQSGLALHTAGKLDDAMAIYRRVLAINAATPDAVHLLGVAEGQKGNHVAALALLRRAVSLLPQASEFHRHLGDVLAMTGQRQEAL